MRGMGKGWARLGTQLQLLAPPVSVAGCSTTVIRCTTTVRLATVPSCVDVLASIRRRHPSSASRCRAIRRRRATTATARTVSDWLTEWVGFSVPISTLFQRTICFLSSLCRLAFGSVVRTSASDRLKVWCKPDKPGYDTGETEAGLIAFYVIWSGRRVGPVAWSESPHIEHVRWF